MRTQQKMKAYYDRCAAEPNFVEGQRVWVFTPKKLLHNYHGPYRIVEKLSPVHYGLRTCGNNSVSSIVHANRMKRFFDQNERPIEPLNDDPTDEPYLAEDDLLENSFEKPPPHVTDPASGAEIVPRLPNEPPFTDPNTESESLIENQTMFNAEKILDKRKVNGEIQYLVKWVNYPINEATSESSSNILDPRLLDDFHSQKSKTP